MDNTVPRAARLQAISERWFKESLGIDFPVLTEADSAPKTRAEFVNSDRISAAFSTLHDNPELAGMAPAAALAQDRELNAERFGVEDPRAALAELSRQFVLAPTGQVSPDAVKKSYMILEVLRNDSTALAAEAGQGEESAKVRAAHMADAEAARMSQALVAELASELGISLPVNRGNGHSGK
jgi:hypothetical protein